MGVDNNYAIKLLKAVNGLCNAPREWHDTVNRDMIALGFRPLSMEPCVWTYWVSGADSHIAMICFIHVDDMVCGVLDGSAVTSRKMKAIETMYRWGRWEMAAFDQCGSDLVQLRDGSILQSLERACKKVAPIELGGSRAAKDEELLSVRSQTACRAALASLQFLASQGMCWLSADISILAGFVPKGTRGLANKSTSW